MRPSKGSGTEHAMKKFKLISAGILIVLVLIVVVQNREPVETKLLFMTITMPRAALLALTALLGVLAGGLLSMGMAKRNKKQEES